MTVVVLAGVCLNIKSVYTVIISIAFNSLATLIVHVFKIHQKRKSCGSSKPFEAIASFRQVVGTSLFRVHVPAHHLHHVLRPRNFLAVSPHVRKVRIQSESRIYGGTFHGRLDGTGGDVPRKFRRTVNFAERF